MAFAHSLIALTLLSLAAGDASLKVPWLRGQAPTTLQEQFEGEHLSADKGKLAAIQRGLRPMYATLPKNPDGRLGHAAASYALRRHFLREYGWLINGLAPQSGGSAWDWKSSSPTQAMGGRVPAALQHMAETSLDGKGLDLENLAVLAYVLERVLVGDSGDKLKESFRLAEVPVDGMITEAQIRDTLEVFMLLYITTGGRNIIGHSPKFMRKFRAICQSAQSKFSPMWAETRAWLHDVERSAAYARLAIDNPFVGGAQSFEGVERLVENVNYHYEFVQNNECLSMKHKLLSMEDTRGTGRLSFSRFQNSSQWGDRWEFKESQEELLAVGALDLSDPAWPRVIITNYIQSPPNCLASQTLHSVCCIDECEALLTEVERGIGAPAGKPEEIARIVARLESETMDNPRNLSTALLGRLDEVATRHQGSVPLHGRLFAQWMHHAFPNECAYPLPRQWSQATIPDSRGGHQKTAEEVLRQELDQGASIGGDISAEELVPWSDEEEELVDETLERGYFMGTVRLPLLLAFLFVAIGTMRSGIKALRSAEKGSQDGKGKR